MRILFLDQFSEMGGAQCGLIDTVDAVRRRGWDCQAAIPGGGPLAEQLRSRGVPTTVIPCGPYSSGRKNVTDMFRFGWDVPLQARTVNGLCERTEFDLLYVNGPRLLPVAALVARNHTPVLFHAHSHIGQPAAAKLVGWSIRRAGATVTACSNFVAEALRAYVGRDRLHVIPNGVRPLEFREPRPVRDGTWRIGIVGRISPEKGHKEFLEAAALLAGIFRKARFVICGAPLFAQPDFFEEVKRRASGLPVEFLGWQEDVAPVFAELDLLAVPSSEEGMGRVVAEAFSAGVPVVAFSTGGLPELITHRETGFLVPEISFARLAACIADVIAMDTAELRKIAANARRKWERCYTVTAYQNRVSAVMESLVPSSQAERETRTLQTSI